MQTTRNTRIALIGGAVAAVAAGGVALAATTGGSGSGYGGNSAATPKAAAVAGASSDATVHVITVTVAGKSERVLADSKGLPLYTYKHDTSKTSRVSGQLAALWPPLVDATPTSSGVTGGLTSLVTTNGQQVAYQGHLLYTFVQDSPGRVTGQGVQDFFVATPGPGAAAAAPAPASTSTAPATSGYGY